MAHSFHLLRLRDFRLLLLTRIFAVMALQAQAVIAGWQIYTITKDPFLLGLAGLVEAVPAILCALVSGHLIDSGRPHRMYVLCIATLAVNTLALLLIAGGFIDVSHVLIWLYVGVFISGLARSFIMPASFSLLPRVVQRGEIPNAAVWFSSGLQLASISAPAIAGLLYGAYGPSVAWHLPFLFFTIALIMLLGMSATPKFYRSSALREPAVKSIKTGWMFILRHPVLLSIMALDMFAVLFGGAIAMLPAYADQVLGIGSQGVGVLRAAPALGAVLVALWFAAFPMKLIRGRMLLWTVAGYGTCMIAFGSSNSFAMAMVCLACAGMFDCVSVVIRATFVQLLTPDSMRGRVSSVNGMFIISSNEIGAFESGVAARLLGLVPSILFGGVATLAVVGGIALGNKRLRRLVIDPKKPPELS